MKYRIKPLEWKVTGRRWMAGKLRIVDRTLYVGQGFLTFDTFEDAREHAESIHRAWVEEGEIKPLRWDGRVAKGPNGNYDICGEFSLFYRRKPMGRFDTLEEAHLEKWIVLDPVGLRIDALQERWDRIFG